MQGQVMNFDGAVKEAIMPLKLLASAVLFGPVKSSPVPLLIQKASCQQLERLNDSNIRLSHIHQDIIARGDYVLCPVMSRLLGSRDILL